ncbi:hypothetical protein HNQ60_000021 [Povalibacter uvarum]|uniref:Flagellar FliJ protein n=1 Tax=Povalibacter uvarum TaxID=732238 RepID=A0A841HGG4_9GAMM|nr:hypothetical protein [Povalibacter uvarum]MBB6091175.1 hypothetical protein [Povalibacter uvarum]
MSNERKALRALRAMKEFEVLEAAVTVAHVVQARQSLQQGTHELHQQSDEAAMHLRATMSRERLDPVLVESLQRAYRAGQGLLRERQALLAEAERREDEALAVLARLRGGQRSIDEALRVEAGNAESRQRSVDMNRVDDLWLQRHVWRRE